MPEFYEPSVLKRLQETELSILKDFVAICEANGLEYYGIAGTGIGGHPPRRFHPVGRRHRHRHAAEGF